MRVTGGIKTMSNANTEDMTLLMPGKSCIIELTTDLGTGRKAKRWWWGTVQHIEILEIGLRVQAKITGGAFLLDEDFEPIMSNERENEMPNSTYLVYPNTETIRMLVDRLVKEESHKGFAIREAGRWKGILFDLMAFMGRGDGNTGSAFERRLRTLILGTDASENPQHPKAADNDTASDP